MDSILKFAASELEGQMGGQQQSQGGQQQYQGGQQQYQGGGQQQYQGGGQQQYQGGGQQQYQQENTQQYQGGQQYQQENTQQHQQGLPAGGLNLATLISGADAQHGNGSDISSLIQNAMGAVGSVSPNASVDESHVQAQHDQAYAQGNGSSMGANALGAAAAVQVFKNFAAAGGQVAGQNAGAGGMLQKLLGMAMSEAVKLFDKSGGAAEGSKQDAVSSAGQTMMKLFVQNQISGAFGGGGASAGGAGGGAQISQLLGLASKFIN